MELSSLFKAIIDADTASVVICDTDHNIVYMNPTAIARHAKKGGVSLIGRSIFECHNADSNEKIVKVVDWFRKSPDNNRLFTFHNPKENKDVYMIALRDDSGGLIGYYEKHEYRTPETAASYDMK